MCVQKASSTGFEALLVETVSGRAESSLCCSDFKSTHKQDHNLISKFQVISPWTQVLMRQQNKKEAQLYGKMFAALGKGMSDSHTKDAGADVGTTAPPAGADADGAGPQSHPIDTPMVTVGEE